MKCKYYLVTCNYIVTADEELTTRDIENRLKEEENFVENHIFVERILYDSSDNVYKHYRKGK